MQQAKKGDPKPFNAKDWRIGIVVAQFNKHITDRLRDGAVARAADYQITEDNIDIVEVAGAVEIPLAVQHLAASGKYNALLAIGCIIRGDTPHFEYVCQFATQGIMSVQLVSKVPIGFGILTCQDEAQAEERARLGGEHLDAALQLAHVLK